MSAGLRHVPLLVGLSIAALATSQAQAQVVTDIAPDTAPGFDTGTVVSTSGSETQIGGGELSGTNLFHSFAEFDLGNGDTATWVRGMADANTITNVINRVRSGSPSNIDGTLTMADMPNADFWFINPAGVVFGDGASVQVPNAAYFSTAHEIGFGGGQRFSTVTPDGSTFSSAPPQAFGFLGGQANLAILGAFATGGGPVQPADVTFVAANIGVDAIIEGDGTQFNLAAVGSDATALALSDLAQPRGSGFIEFTPSALMFADGVHLVADQIGFNGSQVYGNGASNLVVRGNEVVLGNGAVLQSDTLAGQDGDIGVDAGFLLVTTGAAIRTFTDPGGMADGGSIHILADTAIIEAGGNVRAFSAGPGSAGDITFDTSFFSFSGEEISSINDGSGDSGDISIAAQEFFMPGGAIFSEVYGNGAVGNVSVTAQVLEFVGGVIGTATYGAQDSGTVSFDAQNLVMAGNAFLTTQAIGTNGGSAGLISITAHEAQFFGGQATSLGFDGADAGPVQVDIAGPLLMVDRGRIRSLAFDAGDAGAVSVRAGETFMTDGTEIISVAVGDGDAGAVTVELDGQLQMAGVAQVRSRTEGAGDAAAVSVRATDIAMAQEAFIESSVAGAGSAADVTVVGDSLTLFDEAKIRSVQASTLAGGNAGDVTVTLTGDLDLSGFTEIQSSTNGAGLAGDVTVSAANAQLSGNAYIRSNPFGSGAGGRVEVNIDGLLHMLEMAEIESATGGGSSADGGEVVINATDLLMEGGEFNSSSFGSGLGGSVEVNVDNALIDGGFILSAAFEDGDAGTVTLNVANTLQLQGFGKIEAFTLGAGDAGDVLVRAGEVRLNTGQINSDTFGSGNSGSVTVEATGSITLEDQSTFQALASGSATGNAGSVRVVAGDTITIYDQFSGISAETRGIGNAGSVYVEADTILMGPDPDTLFAGGRINSITVAEGNAGDVTVVADTLVLREISRIDATAFFGATGDAGQVRVDVANLIDLGESTRIESNNFGTGAGGDVEVSGGTILLGDQARIRAPALDAGDAGDVRVSAHSLVLAGGGISTSATSGGAAGSVTVDAGSIAISNGAQSDGNITSVTSSTGDAGTVLVRTGSLTMDGGVISSSTFAAGNAGNVTVDAGTIAMRLDASISSAATIEGTAMPTGDAGSVVVGAGESLSMVDDSAILAATDGPGLAGSVIVATPMLTMDGGRIDSSTSSSGDAGNVLVEVADAVLAGAARITSNALTGSTGAAGNVFVDASGSLELQDTAGIIAGTRGAGRAGLVDVSTPVLAMSGGAIASSTESSGDAGDVLITADTALIGGDARINSGALAGSTGQAGLVAIKTSELLLVFDDAVISASTAGAGDAGAVVINSDQLVMEGGEIASFTRGEGNAGTVLVDAQSASLSGGATINSLADGDNTGDAGGVGINVAGELVVADGSMIAASTLGTGNAGKVGVEADTLFLDQALITSATAGAGDAGDVAIAAREMVLFPDGTISSEALEFSSGNAGDVAVTVAETLRLELSSAISASSLGSGFAGIVEVKAHRLDMIGGAINSFTGGSGDAGLVGVFVDELVMTGGRIDSASDSILDNAGNAGSVFIAAGEATIGGWAQIDSRGFAGNAGDVTLDVFGRLDISGMAEISAATDGAGDGGLVQVAADQLVMTGGAINSFTGGSGDAGLVDVLARQITMSSGRIDSSSESTTADAGAAGGVLVRGNDLALSGNAVIESRGVVGDAGDVQLDVLGPVTIADNAQVSAASDGSGDAGSVFVQADLLSMTGGVIDSVTNGSGMAGLVVIDVGDLLMSGGLISSASQTPRPAASLTASRSPLSLGTPGAGDAGDVFLRANTAMLDAGASINSISVNSDAGNVTLAVADTLHLRDGGQVSTAAFGGGDAGAIQIAAGTVLLDGFAQVTSTAAGSFSAGLITMAAGEIHILDGSEVSTNSENGPAGDITLLLPIDGILRLAGQDVPSVITTSSGANTGGQIIISDPFLILSEGGSILALGQQGGANVQIQSAFFIRSSDAPNLVSVDGSLLIESNVGEQITGTEVADVPFLDASGILSGQCSGVRQSGEVSQFSSRITGPYAPPGDPVEADPDEAGEETEADRVAQVDPGSLAPCG